MASKHKSTRVRKSKLEKTSNSVSLQININTRYISKGKITNKDYIWNGAGSVVEVDEEDAPYFLAKIQGNVCCGENLNRHIFTKV